MLARARQHASRRCCWMDSVMRGSNRRSDCNTGPRQGWHAYRYEHTCGVQGGMYVVDPRRVSFGACRPWACCIGRGCQCGGGTVTARRAQRWRL